MEILNLDNSYHLIYIGICILDIRIYTKYSLYLYKEYFVSCGKWHVLLWFAIHSWGIIDEIMTSIICKLCSKLRNATSVFYLLYIFRSRYFYLNVYIFKRETNYKYIFNLFKIAPIQIEVISDIIKSLIFNLFVDIT